MHALSHLDWLDGYLAGSFSMKKVGPSMGPASVWSRRGGRVPFEAAVVAAPQWTAWERASSLTQRPALSSIPVPAYGRSWHVPAKRKRSVGTSLCAPRGDYWRIPAWVANDPWAGDGRKLRNLSRARCQR